MSRNETSGAPFGVPSGGVRAETPDGVVCTSDQNETYSNLASAVFTTTDGRGFGRIVRFDDDGNDDRITVGGC